LFQLFQDFPDKTSIFLFQTHALEMDSFKDGLSPRLFVPALSFSFLEHKIKDAQIPVPLQNIIPCRFHCSKWHVQYTFNQPMYVKWRTATPNRNIFRNQNKRSSRTGLQDSPFKERLD
jgi:hypothetical protein